eukprot:s737_g21.t1
MVKRSFISDFNCRDLCTIAESFAKAGCAEPDFLADLADMLQRKVGDMGAHEVSVAFQVFAPVAMPEGHDNVPTWDGDPASFESFCTSCRWYECSLKESERRLAAPRIWQRLQGSAKSVVRNLEPRDFDSSTGLDKLLAILRESPLQKLPIPDSFSRLEKWSGMRRTSGESIPQLLVREEELFVELQRALKRVREERAKAETRSTGVGGAERDPSQSPSRSPPAGVRGMQVGEPADETGMTGSVHTTDGSMGGNGFFEDEMRGYRLLKASKLSQAERQHVMTLAKNSTHFHLVRQALRSLFSEDQQDDNFKPKKVWYAEAEEPWSPSWEADDNAAYWMDDDGNYWDDEFAYWSEWTSPTNSWDETYNYEEHDTAAYDETQNVDNKEKTAEEIEEDRRVEEAYTLAAEANRTLAEAKQAVARVRAARGYYDPTGTKGHTGKGKGKPKAGKGKGATGPCFTCGRPGHSYLHCPDRWSPQQKGANPQKGKGKPSGFKGGKSFKGKGKKAYFVEMIDGGHIDYSISLDDRPSFRFGNGQTQRAVSKLELMTPALGKVGFFLLDNGADHTPMLIGARELRKRKAMISYKGDWLAYFLDNNWWACGLESLRNGHLALNLLQPRRPLSALIRQITRWPESSEDKDDEDEDDDDDGNDPHRRKRARQHGELSRLVREGTSGTGAYGGGAANTTSTPAEPTGTAETPEPPAEVPGQAPMSPLEDRERDDDRGVDEVNAMESVKDKLVKPSLAKRLAQAACVTAALINPLYELVGMVKPQVDIMEIACSSTSTLTQTFEDHGYFGKRINYKTGFDLDSKKGTEKLLQEVKMQPPKLGWASMVCTRMSSLQNLTPRTPEQLDKFYKRRGQDLRRCDEVVTSLEEILKNDGDVYWVKIDGCQYGLEWKGIPLKKGWTILTSNRDLWLTLNKRCDHTHEHAECRE